ncbi:rCG35429 [Rattus norvegicus]|uniref:RCG35429 n=1 Tax=Rattus norvegicus TaxID=10116 RepID=A6HKR4_RAT|nr:rCG35429 [Rattus norvegicus]
MVSWTTSLSQSSPQALVIWNKAGP